MFIWNYLGSTIDVVAAHSNGATMNPENVIWCVKFSGKSVTFRNCLAVCEDMRLAAMARFIYRLTNGEM